MTRPTEQQHSPLATRRSPLALVTGASRGIGRAIAIELGRLGHAVIVNYAARRDAAEAVVAEIVQAGGSASAVQGDVAKAADRARLVASALGEFGRQDLLGATEESWDRVFDVNLKGPFFLAQAAANAMVRLIGAGTIPGGLIVNVSSISSFAVSTDRADYCMSKAAMQMMTWLLAARLAEEKIQVFEICPGIVETDMTAPVRERYDRRIAEGLSPIRRWGRPEDVAKAVAALAGGAFPFSTGERLHVDGGFHIRRL